MAKKKLPDLPKIELYEAEENPDLVNMLGEDEPKVNINVNPEQKTSEFDNPDVREFIGEFKTVSRDIISNYKNDRGQIEEVVQHLMKLVIHNQDQKLSRTAVENLVKALEVKSNTNANVIKILDSISKVIAAGKGLGVFAGIEEGDDMTFEAMEELLEAEDTEPEKTPDLESIPELEATDTSRSINEQ
jgi:hypothetical protein